MTLDHLKTSLTELHRQLASAGSVDTELKSLLQTLDRDIQQLLARDGAQITAPAVPADAAADDAGLAGRAQELSARLAAQHPQLETVLRELARSLESMGI